MFRFKICLLIKVHHLLYLTLREIIDILSEIKDLWLLLTGICLTQQQNKPDLSKKATINIMLNKISV